MHFILKFFVKKKPIEERLRKSLSKLKNMEFIILSRLDGLPIVMVAKDHPKNSAEISALIASAAALSRRAVNLLYETEIKSISLIMSYGMLIILIRPPLVLSVMIPQELIPNNKEILAKTKKIFDEVYEILA